MVISGSPELACLILYVLLILHPHSYLTDISFDSPNTVPYGLRTYLYMRAAASLPRRD